MSDSLQGIVDHFRLEHPGDAAFYTQDWARQQCARVGLSPADYLAELELHAAEAVAQADITEDDPSVTDLPEHYRDKLGGAVDGFSYGLIHGATGGRV